MSAGFGAERAKDGKAVVIINEDEITKLLKKYKKIKKYRNSTLYKIKTIDGTETIISSLLDELDEKLDDEYGCGSESIANSLLNEMDEKLDEC